jgi:flagellar hook-associated protein 2
MAIGSVYNAYPNGRPSGLPVDIVDQLVDARRQQVVDPVESKIEAAEAKKDTYSSLNTSLRNLYTAADSLDSILSFNDYAVGSSDEDALSGSASISASPNSYDVDISQTAKAHHLLVGSDDAEAGVNLGAADPEDAAFIKDGTTLSFYHQGTEFTYTTDEETTLSSLAESISEEDNGVTAQALNVGSEDAPQYVLSIKSEATGSGSNQVSQDQEGTTTGVTLSDALFLDDGGLDLTTEQEDARAGQDAQFSVDGVDFVRSSNEVDDVLTGVTLKLGDSGTDLLLNVSLNTEGITEKVQAMVNAYNEFKAFMDENAAYNPQTGQAGPLLGDSLARSAQSNLRSIFGSPVSGSGDSSYQYLSQVGIEVQRDGTLEFDTEAFAAALNSDQESVEHLFYGKESVAGKLSSYLRDFTSPLVGTVPSAINSAENKIDNLNDELDDAEQDIERYEERMIDKYTQLENWVMQYQSFGDQISSLIDTWDTSD